MRILTSAIFFCFLALTLNAQQAGSPYTFFGIGAINQNDVTYNAAQGGLGLSYPKSHIVNNLNPALLATNTFSIFDFGIQYDQRNQSTDSLSSSQKGGGLKNITLALPLKSGKWGMALGLSPYSEIKYNIASERGIYNDTSSASYNYKGNGGLTQVYFQTGYRVAKPLYLGFKASYLFGTKDESSIIKPKVVGSFPASYFRAEKYNGFLLGFGAAYRHQFKTEGNYLNIGAILELKTDLKARRSEWFGNDIDIETADSIVILLDNGKSNITIPQKIGLGISYSKEFKWGIGLDYYIQDWNDFRNFYDQNQGLKKSYRWILGGEYTPDFFSVNSYWKRITFLGGVNYVKTPLSFENEDIIDFGINFGVSLPFSNGSTVNFGFTAGQLGTTKNGLIRENYYKISLGISFNDQSYGWYRKQRKFN